MDSKNSDSFRSILDYWRDFLSDGAMVMASAALPRVQPQLEILFVSGSKPTSDERQLFDRMIAAMGFQDSEIQLQVSGEPQELARAASRPRAIVRLGGVPSHSTLDGSLNGVPSHSIGTLGELLTDPKKKRDAWSKLQALVLSLGRELPQH